MTTLLKARDRLRKQRAHALRIAKRHPKYEQRLRAEGRARAYQNSIDWLDVAMSREKYRGLRWEPVELALVSAKETCQ